MLRIAPLFSWPSCLLVGEPLPDGTDVACWVASLPCPAQQHVCRWLQVDGVSSPDLCCQLVALLLAGAAADDPCCALGHGGDVVQAVVHGGCADGVLVKDEITGLGVFLCLGGLACAWRPGDEGDLPGHGSAGDEA
jgi:hypothetical protein